MSHVLKLINEDGDDVRNVNTILFSNKFCQFAPEVGKIQSLSLSIFNFNFILLFNNY